MPEYRLTARAWLPQPMDEVFAFFADAQNLDRLTPPFLGFRIVTPAPISMAEGALIDYRLRLRGLPVKWRTQITAWDPPHRFVDEQLSGPYRLWVHTHTFASLDGGTLMDDEVRYRVPGGAAVQWLLVRRDLLRIFTYRREALRELFGASPSRHDDGPHITRVGAR